MLILMLILITVHGSRFTDHDSDSDSDLDYDTDINEAVSLLTVLSGGVHPYNSECRNNDRQRIE